MLLYTDGLVERRDQVFDDGIALLGRALVEEGDRPVEELCDALLHRLVPHGAEDDVALVAVRLLPRGALRQALLSPPRATGTADSARRRAVHPWPAAAPRPPRHGPPPGSRRR